MPAGDAEPPPTESPPTEPSPTEPSPTEPSPTEPSPTEPSPTKPSPTALQRLRSRARALKRDVLTLYQAARDPRVPWYAKALAACVLAYALSPIDLIPDFIPVLGYLDDLILVPAGIALAIKLIPSDVLADCRERAEHLERRPTSWAGAAVIAALWLGAAALAEAWLWRRF